MTQPRSRLVVVGHGMVAARFLDDLERSGGGPSFDVTVLGDEPHAPYNRLMLSEVIAGRADLGSLTLPPAPGGVTVRSAVAAVSIDRARGVVVDGDGAEHPYDHLVLATGADPRNPLGEFDHGVRALRTIDDCRELLAAASWSRHTVVLGAGLLGVELACGLRARGLPVTIVHFGAEPMERQLDPIAGAVARNTLLALGIGVCTNVSVTRANYDGNRLTGVSLSDGGQIACDQVVVSAGVIPRTALAAAAGLDIDTGIVVDETLRTSDPRIFAIGDCAQTAAGCPGLIAPGWEQAAQLAHQLTERTPAPTTTSGDVVKLKAVGLSVVTMGALASDASARTLSLADVQGGRFVSVTVRDARVVAATCVGAPEVAADLTVAYERGTPIPSDPAHLLMRPIAGATPVAENPTTMPSSATVCRCNGVAKKDIVNAHLAGCRDIASIAKQTRATTGCGGCTDVVCGLLEWMDEANPVPQPAITAAAPQRESDVARP